MKRRQQTIALYIASVALLLIFFLLKRLDFTFQELRYLKVTVGVAFVVLAFLIYFHKKRNNEP